MPEEHLLTATALNSISSAPASAVKTEGIQEVHPFDLMDSKAAVSEFIHRSTLENGIRVITRRIPQARSISIGILFDASPHTEPRDKSGIAHLCEHALFQGTSNRDAAQIAREMDIGGGNIGAFTARDYTCFYATVLDDYRTYALDLLGDILLNSIFPHEHLERDKRAILSEIDSLGDSPLENAQASLKAFAWPNHPLGRPILGRWETVQEFDRDDIIYFMHAHYLPDRMIVAAAGNVDHTDFVAQVRDAFWRMRGQSASGFEAIPQFRGGVTVNAMPVSQAYFCLGIQAFPYAHPDRYTAHVLNAVLGSGLSSRLYRRLREERGLVYHVGSEYHSYRTGGMLFVEGATAPEYAQQTLSLVLTEINGLISGEMPIDDDELWRAKMHISGQHLLAGENIHTCMSRLATQEFYFGHPISSDEVLAQINAVDQKSLQGLLTEQLANSDNQIAVSVVGPESVQGSTLADLIN